MKNIILFTPIFLMLVSCGPSQEEIATNEIYLECDKGYKIFIDTDAGIGEIDANGRQTKEYLEIGPNSYRVGGFRLNRETLLLQIGITEERADDFPGFQCRLQKNKNKI
jgi:hypothetical protein